MICQYISPSRRPRQKIGAVGPVTFGNPFGDGKLEEMMGVPCTVREEK